MITVAIQYRIKEGRERDYAEIAEWIHPQVVDIDGFLSVERYQCSKDPEKWLSLSFWRDEEAVGQWRKHPNHKKAMKRGKQEIFSWYRITVSDALRDYHFPNDSRN